VGFSKIERHNEALCVLFFYFLMIHSLLDNDLYKFTMQQAVLERYPDATAEYTFIDRDSAGAIPPFMSKS